MTGPEPVPEPVRVALPWRVLVVVPARNEETTLGGCLASIDRAAARLRHSRPTVGLEVAVVLDSCTDRSAEALARFPHVRCVPVDLRRVGAARAAGVLAARADRGPTRHPTDRTWLASTDADGEVPPDWLTSQLDRADRGAGAVLGMVQPHRGLSEAVLAHWHALHPAREDHDHVHGANLGVRLDHYDDAGGFEPLEEHEDVRLVDRLVQSGVRVARTSEARVTTSSRRLGRTPGGFAGFLALLHERTAENLTEVSTRAAG